MPSLQMPSFDLTTDYLETTRSTIVSLLDTCESIFGRPKPLSVFDYSEALRYVRCAIFESWSLEDSGAPFLSRCYLCRGDCLRGLGRLADAQASYQEAASVVVPLDGSALLAGEDWLLHKVTVAQAREKLLTMEHSIVEAAAVASREKRIGGLWDGHDMSAVANQGMVGAQERDEELRMVGRMTETWDPEPKPVVCKVARSEPVETGVQVVPCTIVTTSGEVEKRMTRLLKAKKGLGNLRAIASKA